MHNRGSAEQNLEHRFSQKQLSPQQVAEPVHQRVVPEEPNQQQYKDQRLRLKQGKSELWIGIRRRIRLQIEAMAKPTSLPEVEDIYREHQQHECEDFT